MERRFSEMTDYELRQEVAGIREKAKHAEQAGMISELAVWERKAVMAEAYLLNPEDFRRGGHYTIKHDDEGNDFEIVYLNGVFAWGKKDGASELSAYPVSLLMPKEA